MAPSLSIILTNYNYAHHLPTAIESVLNQSYIDYELLIIDDGSTDESHRVIQAYANKSPRIRLHLRKENSGAIYTINEAIDLVEGRYIHWFSADDMYLPDFLQASMDVLINNPDLGLCCSNFANFDDGKIHDIRNQPLIPNKKNTCIYKVEEMIPLFQTTLFWIPGHTTIVKKELVVKYGKFNPDFNYKCDYMLYHTIALNAGIAYIPRPLAAMRMHPTSFSHVGSAKLSREVHKRILSDLRKKPALLNQFRRSTLLAFVFMDRFWFKLINPRYTTFWYYVNRRCPLKEKMIQSFKYHYSRLKQHLGLCGEE